MSLDFTNLGGQSVLDTATEPRRIFAALPSKHPNYGYPRDVQSEIWDAWHARRSDRDLVIKMNTGGGKTVVGLTLLKSCLNEKVGPAVYVTPNNHLTEQALAEAGRLGLKVTTEPRDPSFQSGRSILIINIAKLVNGKSVFGIAGDSRQRIKIGAVVIDDAHACVATIAEQFTLKIPYAHAAYAALLEMFESDLRFQSPAGWKDLGTKDRRVALRVPFWAWEDRRDQVLDLLHQYRDDEEFQWAWPLIKDALPLCRPVISADSIEIAPPCPAIDQIPAFAEAQRRIYMTATLADDSILVTHCGADAKSIAIPITPRSAGDLGDRMILTPMDSFPGIDDDDIRDLLVNQAKRHNVVVIVPSRRRADWWRPHAAEVHDATSIAPAIERLKAGHVGLVVLINKYDGVDLAESACRILVIDGLPEAYSGQDRLEALALDDTQAMVTRQIQRIEQGMGRGVRSNEDFCVVILMGARLIQRLNQMGSLTDLSPGTRAQIDLSQGVAEMLSGKPFSDLPSVIDQCLTRDPTWVAASRNRLDSVTYDPTSLVTTDAVAQREAFELATIGQFGAATAKLQKAIDVTTDPKLRGWLKEIAAGYLHRVDQVKAQALQASAKADNKALLTPKVGVKYAPVKWLTDQAEAASKHLSETYSSSAELAIGIHALVDDLMMVGDDQRASQRFERAMLDLAHHLGLPAERPDHDQGVGPDLLWAIGLDKYLIIECKSEATTDFIAKKDAAQLSQSMDWFEQSYPNASGTPMMVHPVAKLHAKATMPASSRVIDRGKLASLRTAAATYGRALSAGGTLPTTAEIAAQLKALHLAGPSLINSYAIPPRAG